MPARRTHARHTRPRPDPGRVKRSTILAVDFSPGFWDFIASADPTARRTVPAQDVGQGLNSTEGARPASRDALSTAIPTQGTTDGCSTKSDV